MYFAPRTSEPEILGRLDEFRPWCIRHGPGYRTGAAVKKIYLLELRDPRRGLASTYLNSLMLPILAVWAERLGWQAEVSFTQFEKVDYDRECDGVALSVYTFLAPQGYEVARRFRERGKVVIIGGPHTKGSLDEVRSHANIVYNRCDEPAWARALQAIADGQVTARTRPAVFFPSEEMRAIPSYLEIKKFYGDDKVPMLLSSLGCPHDCDWCTDWNSTYFKRSVDAVIEDVSNISSKFFVFADPNFGVNRKFTGQLLARMIPLKKKYLMETSLVWLMDDEFLQLLRDSGCIGVELGLESLTADYKKNAMKKADSKLEEAIRRIERVKKYIELLQVNFVLGLDEDTPETFPLVVELYRRSKADTLGLHIVTPFPGTPFFDRMRAEGRIFDTDWSDYNCETLTITLRNMEVPQFYDLYVQLRKEINSPWLVLRKTLDNFRQFRDPWMTYLVFRVLAFRSWYSFRHDIPLVQRAKMRWQEKSAGTPWGESLPSPAR